MSFVKRLSVALSLIVCLSVARSAWSASAFSQAAAPQDPPTLQPVGAPLSAPTPAQPAKTLSNALRQGKYPAQLAGSTGASRPDQQARSAPILRLRSVQVPRRGSRPTRTLPSMNGATASTLARPAAASS